MLNVSLMQIYEFINAMVLQRCSLVCSDLCGGKKQLFYFFVRWLMWLEKMNVLFERWLF